MSEQPAKQGLWSKITGSGTRGVLRLVDVAGERPEPALTALATMLVHRADARLANDDAPGAPLPRPIEQLRRALWPALAAYGLRDDLGSVLDDVDSVAVNEGQR